MNTVFEHLLGIQKEKGAGYLVLIDPDRKNDGILDDLVPAVNESNADAILVGGSFFMDGKFHERAARIKELAKVPVILFPGAANQLGPHFDAVLFMSVISGRNSNYLIGEQVHYGRLDAEPPLSGQRLAGQLEQDLRVLGSLGHSPTLKRMNRAISIFSPVLADIAVINSPTVWSGFFTNGCARRVDSLKNLLSLPSMIFAAMSSGLPCSFTCSA